MLTIDNILTETERVFGLKLPSDYKKFLSQFLELEKPLEFNWEIKGSKKALCLDTLFNIVNLIDLLSCRHTYEDLIKNHAIFIGGFIGGESLCMGVGKDNFGIVYFVETDLYEFVPISESFHIFHEDVLKYRL